MPVNENAEVLENELAWTAATIENIANEIVEIDNKELTLKLKDYLTELNNAMDSIDEIRRDIRRGQLERRLSEITVLSHALITTKDKWIHNISVMTDVELPEKSEYKSKLYHISGLTGELEKRANNITEAKEQLSR